MSADLKTLLANNAALLSSNKAQFASLDAVKASSQASASATRQYVDYYVHHKAPIAAKAIKQQQKLEQQRLARVASK